MTGKAHLITLRLNQIDSIIASMLRNQFCTQTFFHNFLLMCNKFEHGPFSAISTHFMHMLDKSNECITQNALQMPLQRSNAARQTQRSIGN